MQVRIGRFMVLFTLAIGAIGLFAACTPAGAPSGASSGGASAPVASANMLTAVKVDATSSDGAAAVWANAPVLTGHTKAAEKGKADGPAVNLQAVYDGKNVAVRLEWAIAL